MKDPRMEKLKQHYDIYIDHQKYKVLSCQVSEAERRLSIVTIIQGQSFPRNGQFVITIPSEDVRKEINLHFQSMWKSASVEHWEYLIL